MADKVQLIKEEIERRIKEGSSKNDISEGALALDSLLDFIDSLPEEHNEDLEEYYKKDFLPKEWFAKPGQRTISQFNFFTARHFAEWQKQKDQETIELAEDHAMLAGMNRMKEEMMKDAVEGRVQCGYGDGNKLSIKAMLPQDSDLKYADKVKVLILKTE